MLIDDRSVNMVSRTTGWERYAREVQSRVTADGAIRPVDLRPGSKSALIRTDWIDLPVRAAGDYLFMPTYPPSSALDLSKVSWVLHDLTWLTHTEWSSRLGRTYYRWLASYALKHVRQVITPSEAVRQELVHRGVEAQRVKAIYPGTTDLACVKRDVPVPEPSRRFVLYVGSIEPRKNLAILARCWEQAELHSRYELVIAGRAAWGKLPEGATHIDSPSDGCLAWLYANAQALAVPSFYEGFGLPLAEASAFGLPIACSDIPVFREVAPATTHFFDPRDVKAATRAILGAASCESRECVARFTWDETVRSLREHLKV